VVNSHAPLTARTVSPDLPEQRLSEKPLRILFCAWNYFPAPAGGAERQARLQAEELVSRGHEVTVICPRVAGVGSGTIAGVRVRRLFKLYVRPFGRITYLTSILFFMARAGRRYDVIHIHLANLQADVIVPIARLLRRPVYAKIACGGEIGEVRRLAKVAKVTRWVGLRNANAVQALSEEIASELVGIGVRPERIVRLTNGLDTRRFSLVAPTEKSALRDALSLPRDRVLVLFAGRFARYKGLDDLLRVWKDHSFGASATLVLVGAADTDQPMDPIAEDLPGLVVREWTNEIVDYLRACDVFAYPSRTDGMSNAVLEAASCSLAVVASTSGATAEVFSDGDNALLFEPGDRNVLAGHLERVLRDSVLREELGSKAAKRASSLGIDAIVDGLESAYARILFEQ
jgi:glycosyltransferase involved in cell wall biosynthesis